MKINPNNMVAARRATWAKYRMHASRVARDLSQTCRRGAAGGAGRAGRSPCAARAWSEPRVRESACGGARREGDCGAPRVTPHATTCAAGGGDAGHAQRLSTPARATRGTGRDRSGNQLMSLQSL